MNPIAWLTENWANMIDTVIKEEFHQCSTFILPACYNAMLRRQGGGGRGTAGHFPNTFLLPPRGSLLHLCRTLTAYNITLETYIMWGIISHLSTIEVLDTANSIKQEVSCYFLCESYFPPISALGDPLAFLSPHNLPDTQFSVDMM